MPDLLSLQPVLDRLAKLETQGAADVKAIAQLVIEGLQPMVREGTESLKDVAATVRQVSATIETVAVEFNAGVTEIVNTGNGFLALAGRIDGAKIVLGTKTETT
jgi:hypothetical protein